MITKAEAMTAREFHEESIPCDGKRSNRWRRNGKTQTWKTRPDEFRVPVKFGLRGYGNITELNASDFHTAENCPYNA